MPINYSNLGKFGIDILDGNGMHTMPLQPTDMKANLPSDPIIFVNGTQGIPQFWDVLLTFSTVPKNKYQEFAKLWKPGGQRIRVNLQSMVNPLEPATGNPGSGWFETDAIWRLPPAATTGQIRGFIVYDFNLTLNRVELDWLNPPVG